MNLSALFSEAFCLTGEEHNVEQLGGAQGTAGYSALSSRSQHTVFLIKIK